MNNIFRGDHCRINEGNADHHWHFNGNEECKNIVHVRTEWETLKFDLKSIILGDLGGVEEHFGDGRLNPILNVQETFIKIAWESSMRTIS